MIPDGPCDLCGQPAHYWVASRPIQRYCPAHRAEALTATEERSRKYRAAHMARVREHLPPERPALPGNLGRRGGQRLPVDIGRLSS